MRVVSSGSVVLSDGFAVNYQIGSSGYQFVDRLGVTRMVSVTSILGKGWDDIHAEQNGKAFVLSKEVVERHIREKTGG